MICQSSFSIKPQKMLGKTKQAGSADHNHRTESHQTALFTISNLYVYMFHVMFNISFGLLAEHQSSSIRQNGSSPCVTAWSVSLLPDSLSPDISVRSLPQRDPLANSQLLHPGLLNFTNRNQMETHTTMLYSQHLRERAIKKKRGETSVEDQLRKALNS